MLSRVKWNVKGSFTIEASYLIPFVFALILLFLSWSLHFYDRIAAEAWVYQTIVKYAYEKEDGETDEAIPAIRTKFDQTIMDGKMQVEVSAEGRTSFLSEFELAMTGLSEPSIKKQETAKKISGETVVRIRTVFQEGNE